MAPRVSLADEGVHDVGRAAGMCEYHDLAESVSLAV